MFKIHLSIYPKIQFEIQGLAILGWLLRVWEA